MSRRITQVIIFVLFTSVLAYGLFGGTTNEELCIQQGRQYVKVGYVAVKGGILPKMECR